MRAASPLPMMARDLDALRQALHNMPQKRECAQCQDTSKLQCPKCPQGQVCQYSIPTDCTQCAQTICMVDDSPQAASNTAAAGGSSSSGGPSAAPIAGGVISGIVVIATLTYLVWRFLIKPKRSRNSPTIYSAKTPRDAEKDNASRFTHRSSTHTVHSIASTVLTRASNIIQIAYIPGVTNRATPTSPSVLVPPVPPIPMQHQQGNRGSDQENDQRFFVPGNLRDSTYSGISDYSDRTSYAPRSSIASTIYGRQAQVQTPAQTGMRAKPTVVSVRPGGAGAANPAPPMPSIDYERFGGGRPKSVASTLSVGSTLVNSANTATQARAHVVKLGVGGGAKKINVETNKTSPPPSSNESPSSLSSSPSSSSNSADASPSTPDENGSQGPFSDPPKSGGVRTLVPVMEDDGEPRRGGDDDDDTDVKTTATTTIKRPSSMERGRSPFGDEHATKE
ncbi:hypothetical protein L249_1567 [Ophiocordyceps polyrhachis-furcata BCC 54312]|uniref:Membrane anchor Opy2 N-terminal domain-containing protein n=1 Tax=Ophiocordyceps polyrhachis-furcata BCC 54312 TaxID=1330021 RepID=A0A367L3Z5_9HYPO|nr:hypothetical protein L249_1567 [Ophiocordyceps polyrhachis-furcata BCC 54312]